MTYLKDGSKNYSGNRGLLPCELDIDPVGTDVNMTCGNMKELLKDIILTVKINF